jgi:hypothetical protein
MVGVVVLPVLVVLMVAAVVLHMRVAVADKLAVVVYS